MKQVQDVHSQCYPAGGSRQKVVGGAAVHPHIHAQHGLFNGCGCSHHLFVHHVSQLLFQDVLPLGTEILENNCTVRNGVHCLSGVYSRERGREGLCLGQRFSHLSHGMEALDGVAHWSGVCSG